MQIVKVTAGSRDTWERVYPFVYCGRRAGGFAASPLGNPFRVGPDGDLAEVLAKYREWLWSRVRADTAQRSALEALPEAAVLGCWCVTKEAAGEGPEECHCDVIAKAWRWLHAQTPAP